MNLLSPNESIFECRDCHRWVGWKFPEGERVVPKDVQQRFLSLEESTALALAGLPKRYGFCSRCANKTLMSVFSKSTEDK